MLKYCGEKRNKIFKHSPGQWLRDFVKLKKSEWVGQTPTQISFFFEILCFSVVFSVVHVSEKKKLDRQVGGWCLDKPSFSRIFGQPFSR